MFFGAQIKAGRVGYQVKSIHSGVLAIVILLEGKGLPKIARTRKIDTLKVDSEGMHTYGIISSQVANQNIIHLIHICTT